MAWLTSCGMPSGSGDIFRVGEPSTLQTNPCCNRHGEALRIVQPVDAPEGWEMFERIGLDSDTSLIYAAPEYDIGRDYDISGECDYEIPRYGVESLIEPVDDLRSFEQHLLGRTLRAGFARTSQPTPEEQTLQTLKQSIERLKSWRRWRDLQHLVGWLVAEMQQILRYWLNILRGNRRASNLVKKMEALFNRLDNLQVQSCSEKEFRELLDQCHDVLDDLIHQIRQGRRQGRWW
ncbi:MAG: hypothetical protein HPY54_16610 [Chthonomonadetes bacterium]|nr:hypothetical protein [Chthonomonadetes bacterium]